MIRPAAEALKKRPRACAAIILLWALTLFLPGLLGLSGLSASASASAWLEGYRPVVYLKADTSAEARDKLKAELADWPEVRAVITRAPTQALADLKGRLGDEQVQHLGITTSVLPTSLIIEPVIPVHDHIGLAARAASLEARADVELVSAPGAGALQVLSAVRVVLALALLVGLLLLASAVLLTSQLLRTIQQDERRELELLEIFGASRMTLGRPTLMRGAILGAWGGASAACGLILVQLVHQHSGWFPAALQADPRAWGLILVIAIVSPALGLLAAQLTLGRERPTHHALPEGLEPMLIHDWSTTPMVS